MSDKKANILLFTGSLLVCLIIAEVALRVVLADELRIVTSERSLTYQHDEELGWKPIPNSETQFNLTTYISIKHNSRGFRDVEHEPTSKDGIVFIGDSFTWGYDVEADERFTDLLRDSLPDYQLFNLGISGYGTDQEYMLLQEHFDFYQPKIVFLTFCADNDRLDNSMNIRYINYYKPYYLIENNELKLYGRPAPTSAVHWFAEHPFWSVSYIIRLTVNAWYKNRAPEKLVNDDPTHQIFSAIDHYLQERGSKLIVGLQKPDVPLMTHLEAEQIPYLDLSNDMVFPFSGNHWTPDGHKEVAHRIKTYIDNLDQN